MNYASVELGDGTFKERWDKFEELKDTLDCDYDNITWPPNNIWVGASVENQKAADTRIELLKEIPAKVRFLSMEPLLGPVTLPNLDGVHWVIVGGESGPGARPCHQAWVESLLSQCREAGVSFFFKQKGNVWAKEDGDLANKGGEVEEFPEHLRVREFPKTSSILGSS